MKKRKLMIEALNLLKKRGQKASDIARKAILQEKIQYAPLSEALRYFTANWRDFNHPALLSLACEAVGGHPDATTNIGAAIVLLTSAADIHDDIIDQSITKGGKLTVFGKFDKDIALLAGEIFLFKGLTLLHDECQRLHIQQKQAIIKLTEQAFFEIVSAEAKETSFKGKYDLAPEEYSNIIGMKAAIAEATMRIGAILGCGTSEEIDALGHYGRTLGIVTTIRDEFIDIFEPNELKNRAEKECLPLPILYAFKNTKTKNEVIRLLKKRKLTEKNAYTIVDAVTDAKEVKKLKKQMQMLIRKEVKRLNFVTKSEILQGLKLLLLSVVEDL
ncbi:MAG: polyprenyl synthetase family protein [Candidatus Bathyarchaeia archaeon]